MKLIYFSIMICNLLIRKHFYALFWRAWCCSVIASARCTRGRLSEVVGKLEGEPHSVQAVPGVDAEVDGQKETHSRFPRNDPLSSASAGPRDEARLKVHLARFQMEIQEKAQNRQAQLQFQLETEADKAVRLSAGVQEGDSCSNHIG